MTNADTQPTDTVLRIVAHGLDPITCLISQLQPGRGRITVQCYASAWTAFWGAMGGDGTLQGFLLRADTEYIVDNLMWGRNGSILKRCEAREKAWLANIVEAIKQHLRQHLRQQS